jgi:hypothetical protein
MENKFHRITQGELSFFIINICTIISSKHWLLSEQYEVMIQTN